MAKVGLYFGSFNPIHIGHIAIAGYISEFTDLDQVWFVVSPHNPLKAKETLLNGYDRLRMVDLALGGSFKLRSCDVEFRLPVPSYTVDTMAYLTEKYPSHKFSLIMGEDNLATIHKWKNIGSLISNFTFYVYPRRDGVPGHSPLAPELKGTGNIRIVDAPIMDISGSFIRKGIKEGKDMSYFLPQPVWNYIDKNQYYR